MKSAANPFGPDRVGLKEIHMFKKTLGFVTKGFVFKFGLLVERVPKSSFVAAVCGPEEFAEEKFETFEAALHWAESRATWKTGADAIDREIWIWQKRWNEEVCVYRAEVLAVQTVVVSRVL